MLRDHLGAAEPTFRGAGPRPGSRQFALQQSEERRVEAEHEERARIEAAGFVAVWNPRSWVLQ